MTEEQNPREKPQRNVPRDLKPYFLGLLTRGDRWNRTDDREAEDLLPKQLAFLREQMEAGRYVVAGPMKEESAYVGMMIIQAATKEEALLIASADPGVQAGRLSVEIHPVYLPSLEGVRVRY